MAATLTQQILWMGPEHVENVTTHPAIIREDNEEQDEQSIAARQRTADLIKHRLDRIKHQLGLGGSDGLINDAWLTEEYLAKMRREAAAKQARSDAIAALAREIKGANQRHGTGYVSYLDGTAHETPAALADHNHRTAILFAAHLARHSLPIALPNVNDFDLAALAEAHEQLQQCNTALKAINATIPPQYAAAKENLETARVAYNQRAMASARFLLAEPSLACIELAPVYIMA